MTEAAVVLVSQELPSRPTFFTGRDDELIAARSAAAHAFKPGGDAVILAIDGLAGVGKSHLANEAAHDIAGDARPEIVLTVDLRGHAIHGSPADPAAVLDGFLRSLGVAGAEIARQDLVARSAHFRELVAGRSLLLFLDDVASEKQVLPLIPGTARSVVILTSRRTLRLPGMVRVPLDVFTHEDAIKMLHHRLGPDVVESQAEEATAIAGLVGHLPLALALVADRMDAYPDWTLTDHLDRLTERRETLHTEKGVETALNTSYTALPDPHRRLLQLMALHPGDDIDQSALAAMAAAPYVDISEHVQELMSANLVEERRAGHFRLHDLVGVFVASRARDELPARLRRTALKAYLDHLRATALEAMRVYAPQESARHPIPEPTVVPAIALRDRESAVQWLAQELVNLVQAATAAARDGWPVHAAHLASILFRYLDQSGHFDEAEHLHSLSIGINDEALRARAWSDLGVTAMSRGRHDLALARLDAAAELYLSLGDEVGEFRVRMNQGGSLLFLGRFDESRRRFEIARQRARAADDTVLEAAALGNLGVVLVLLGHDQEAHQLFTECLSIARASGDRSVQTHCHIHLGVTLGRLGRHHEALEELHTGQRLAQEIQHRVAELDAVNQEGTVLGTIGRFDEAVELHQKALGIAVALGVEGMEAQVRNDMGFTLARAGCFSKAVPLHRRARDLATALHDRLQEAEALRGLGTCALQVGRNEEANRDLMAARELHHLLGTPQVSIISDLLTE